MWSPAQPHSGGRSTLCWEHAWLGWFCSSLLPLLSASSLGASSSLRALCAGAGRTPLAASWAPPLTSPSLFSTSRCCLLPGSEEPSSYFQGPKSESHKLPTSLLLSRPIPMPPAPILSSCQIHHAFSTGSLGLLYLPILTSALPLSAPVTHSISTSLA